MDGLDSSSDLSKILLAFSEHPLLAFIFIMFLKPEAFSKIIDAITTSIKTIIEIVIKK